MEDATVPLSTAYNVCANVGTPGPQLNVPGSIYSLFYFRMFKHDCMHAAKHYIVFGWMNFHKCHIWNA
jgi:hypothetical protein